ncbi:hypothetical protein B6K86_04395 [Lachnospiraceae bacterium]|nr:hypothetical protein B6K86_04395 [Lachnospiraceae bacterium]
MYSRPISFLFQNSAPVENAIEKEERQKIFPRISHEKDSKLFQSISKRIQSFPLFARIIILGELSCEPLIFIKNPCNKTCDDKRNKEPTFHKSSETLYQRQWDKGNNPAYVHAIQTQQFNKVNFRENAIPFFHKSFTQQLLLINR